MSQLGLKIGWVELGLNLGWHDKNSSRFKYGFLLVI